MTKTCLATMLVLALAAPSVRAGDVCPIAIYFQDNGTPDGVDRAAVLAALESRSAWFGLTYEGVTFVTGEQVARTLQIHADSPAEAAGLKVNDHILAIDGRPVTTRADVDAAFAAVAPTATVTLRLRRDDTLFEATMQRGPRDPVVAAMFAFARERDCVAPGLVGAARDADRARAWAAITTASGALRCKDAHRRLAATDPDEADMQEGVVQVFRTADQLLVTMPRFATVCVKAADLDGARLDDKAIGRIFDRVTSAYLAREKRRTP